MGVESAVDAVLERCEQLLGFGVPPNAPAPDAPRSIGEWPTWTGSASDRARDVSVRLDHERDQQYLAHTAVTRLINGAQQTIFDARTRMAGVRADWERDKTAVGARRWTPEGQATLAQAGGLRVGEADAVIRDAATQFGNAAHDVRNAVMDLPLPLDNPSIKQVPVDAKDVPKDPKQFHDFWERLTPAERDALYQQDHLIGNRDGMPAVDRDRYNRQTLATELARAQAQGDSKYLADLQAVDRAMRQPDRKLMLLDLESGRQARAAIAVGDPDSADHVSVTTPGLNTTVHGGIEGMADEATHVRKEALNQLALAGKPGETVAAIAWIGYDPPQVPGTDDIGASLKGGWEVSHDDVAKAGAQDLARFYDGINAAHHGPLDLTAIGHSYGSLTTGLALQVPGDHGVDNALFYGSPGIEASTPAQLGLQPGHVFTMETPDDPIQNVYDVPPVARAVAPFLPFGLDAVATTVLGGLDASGAGQFGPNPATNPNFTHLSTAEAVVPDGRLLAGASGHSDYPRWNGDQPYTTGYNIAAVIAGTAPVPQK